MMTHHDQQIIRTLSNNMTDHLAFFQTPKLVSDLIHIADALKGVLQSERNEMLTELIEQLNKNLPANVYLPISHENVLAGKYSNKRKGDIKQNSNHKIL